jgi:probable H4MPT-linked C1 transfer pathway protein
MNFLGLDIGGANIKAALIKTKKGKMIELKSHLEYFPIWKFKKNQLSVRLRSIKKRLTKSIKLDSLGVTITAELSDAFFTKKEGINHVLDSILNVFDSTPKYILNVEGNFISIEEAREQYLKVASSNWIATGWMISQLITNCIVIDVGSTTTSIIPIIDGKIVAKGMTDLEKLANGELVYTGSLRTPIAAIVNWIPVRKKMTRVSSELFSQSGDVHLLIGNIDKKDFTTETVDGRGKSKKEAAGRLARVVCADTDMLNEQEIIKMAKFVYQKQIDQIYNGLKQVLEENNLKDKVNSIVLTGLGRNFLARKAAEKVSFNNIIDFGELMRTREGVNPAVISPSIGVALMVANTMEEKSVKWMQC